MIVLLLLLLLHGVESVCHVQDFARDVLPHQDVVLYVRDPGDPHRDHVEAVIRRVLQPWDQGGAPDHMRVCTADRLPTAYPHVGAGGSLVAFRAHFHDVHPPEAVQAGGDLDADAVRRFLAHTVSLPDNRHDVVRLFSSEEL